MVDVDGIRERLDASTWAGVGLLGLLVFFVGVGLPYLPGGKSLPDHTWLPIVVAIVGGIFTALGLGFAYDLREGNRTPKRPSEPPVGSGPVDSAPSFEIYRPSDAPEPDSGSR
ncbi:MAG: hypothetical protein L3K16_07125 [Thermoplasmata archaeon]|nr:hypothetical protein [Thermoplasmata archaeon]